MLKNLLSIFVCPDCPLCQRQTQQIICTYCQKKVQSNYLSTRKIIESKNLSVFAWGKYEGELKRAIASVKYENNPQLGVLLGEWLAHSWLASFPSKKIKKLTVVPIPLHSQKLKLRGFNQATKIAQGFCQVTGYQLKSQALIRVKNTQAMFGLNPQQRQTNIKNALVVNHHLEPTLGRSPILILDDIYTTGSTIRSAYQAFTQSSFKVYGGVVVAAVITDKP